MMKVCKGYTLIELLVVIAIISIVAVIGFANYKTFASDQITVKASGEVQTFLRLTQSNATSSTFCDSTKQNVGPWSLTFKADGNGTKNTIDLACGPTNAVQKTFVLQNAEVSIRGFDCGATDATLPFTITYSNGVGALTISFSGASANCLASATWTFTITNTKDTNKIKVFKLSKGGSIDVQ